MLSRNFGYALTILGILVMCVGVMQVYTDLPIPSFALLVVDSSPPNIWLTIPANGREYWNLHYAVAYVKDPESGVKTVTLTIDGQSYSMRLEDGDVNDGTWRAHFDPLPSGSHTFKIVAKNNAGLKATVSGTFKIREKVPLEGEWYVNDQKITSKDQTVYIGSNDVTFKFVKTKGSASSSNIVVQTVIWIRGAHKTKILDYMGNNTWMGTWHLEDGQYKCELVADDFATGTHLTMSIVNLQIGNRFNIPSALLNGYTVGGLATSLLGLIFILKGGM